MITGAIVNLHTVKYAAKYAKALQYPGELTLEYSGEQNLHSAQSFACQMITSDIAISGIFK